jgi:hypothetical protein
LVLGKKVEKADGKEWFKPEICHRSDILDKKLL